MTTAMFKRRSVPLASLSEGEQEFLSKLRSGEFDFIDNPIFYNKGLRWEEPLQELVPETSWFDAIMADLQSYLANPNQKRQRVLTAAEEREFFFYYNWLRMQIWTIQQRWWKRGGSLTSKERWRILDLHRRSLKIEEKISGFNLGLILAMAKKTGLGEKDVNLLADMWTDSGIALLRSIRKFDAGRGYKFSTYACQALLKQMWRFWQKAQKVRHKETNLSTLSRGDDDEARKHLENVAFKTFSHVTETKIGQERIKLLRAIMDNDPNVSAGDKIALTDDERYVLRERFYSSNERLATLEEIGSKMETPRGRSLTKERVRQLVKSGIEKLSMTFSAMEASHEEREDIPMGLDVVIDPEKVLDGPWHSAA